MVTSSVIDTQERRSHDVEFPHAEINIRQKIRSALPCSELNHTINIACYKHKRLTLKEHKVKVRCKAMTHKSKVFSPHYSGVAELTYVCGRIDSYILWPNWRVAELTRIRIL